MGATLLLMLLVSAGGILFTLEAVDRRIRHQIELDRFTGKIAIQLRATLITLEQSRNRLKIARAAMLSGCLNPMVCPSLLRAFELQRKIEEKIQSFCRTHWKIQEVEWISTDPLLSEKGTFPDLETTLINKKLHLKIQKQRLRSAARVWKEDGIGFEIQSSKWKIAWIE